VIAMLLLRIETNQQALEALEPASEKRAATRRPRIRCGQDFRR